MTNKKFEPVSSNLRIFVYIVIAGFWAYMAILGWTPFWMFVLIIREDSGDIMMQLAGAFLASFIMVRLIDRKILQPYKAREKRINKAQLIKEREQNKCQT